MHRARLTINNIVATVMICLLSLSIAACSQMEKRDPPTYETLLEPETANNNEPDVEAESSESFSRDPLEHEQAAIQEGPQTRITSASEADDSDEIKVMSDVSPTLELSEESQSEPEQGESTRPALPGEAPKPGGASAEMPPMTEPDIAPDDYSLPFDEPKSDPRKQPASAHRSASEKAESARASQSQSNKPAESHSRADSAKREEPGGPKPDELSHSDPAPDDPEPAGSASDSEKREQSLPATQEDKPDEESGSVAVSLAEPLASEGGHDKTSEKSGSPETEQAGEGAGTELKPGEDAKGGEVESDGIGPGLPGPYQGYGSGRSVQWNMQRPPKGE